MKLDCIISMANETVRLRFLAMERSLRATGCRLPLRVIPYDERRFSLPAGATWWEEPALFEFLREHRAHPTMRKYACLMRGGYQFVDADVVFLRDPNAALESAAGWVNSCGSWRDPAHVLTPDLRRVLAGISPLAQQRLFNSGQFACDRVLYDERALRAAVLDPAHRATTLDFPYHEQPGLNLLVNLAHVPISNLTLPPGSMESTWAGDYPGEFEAYWRDEARTPYLIHWAGWGFSTSRPIDRLYLRHLTPLERTEWDQAVARHAAVRASLPGRMAELKRRLRLAAAESVSILRSGTTRDQDRGLTG